MWESIASEWPEPALNTERLRAAAHGSGTNVAPIALRNTAAGRQIRPVLLRAPHLFLHRLPPHPSPIFPSILGHPGAHRHPAGTMSKGRCQKKKRFFLGLCPKHRTPPTHRARLGLH